MPLEYFILCEVSLVCSCPGKNRSHSSCARSGLYVYFLIHRMTSVRLLSWIWLNFYISNSQLTSAIGVGQVVITVTPPNGDWPIEFPFLLVQQPVGKYVWLHETCHCCLFDLIASYLVSQAISTLPTPLDSFPAGRRDRLNSDIPCTDLICRPVPSLCASLWGLLRQHSRMVVQPRSVQHYFQTDERLIIVFRIVRDCIM